jgi:hypothetical protein
MTTFTTTLVSKNTTITGAHRDLSFWFAILSPLIGVLVGFLALLLLVH